VPGTSNIFFHDILYTVRFVKMRRVQQYYFHYLNCAGKQLVQQNTTFFFFVFVFFDLALC